MKMKHTRRFLFRFIFPLTLVVMCLIAYTLMMAKRGYDTPPTLLPEAQQADLIVVHKAAHRLVLLHQGEMLASYPVSLGPGASNGPKRQEGDRKTPEGQFVIDRRNPHSRFSLSLHISYPDNNAVQHARERGVSPGGDIMIHGMPNGWGWLKPVFQRTDWTDGCIALTNDEMREVWRHVPTGTPVQIDA